MKNIIDMSAQHQFVWTSLQILEDHERILGPGLQEHAGIKDPRVLYQIIKDLRHNGYLVGGNKNGDRGYYEIRTAEELDRTTHSLRSPAFDLLNTAGLMEKFFLEKNYDGMPLVSEEEEEDIND